MERRHAIELISNGVILVPAKTLWADLGCGRGLFTTALASLLQPGSKIVAVDKDAAQLETLTPNQVNIEFLQMDFVTHDPGWARLDGIIMANALHFVNDQISFLQKTARWLKQHGHLLIVEYDMDIANRWVPFPVSFGALKNKAAAAGAKAVIKLHERPSVFRKASIYSTLISF